MLSEFILNKGIGLLIIDVFVATEDTLLNHIAIDQCFNFRVANEHILNDIYTIRGNKKSNQLGKFYKKGAYGISIYKGEELAAYGWIGLNRNIKKSIRFFSFNIPPNSARIFECYTVEKFRGQNLYPAIAYYLVNWARLQQVGNVFIDTVSGNIAARKSVIKLGLCPVYLQFKLLFLNKILFEYDRKR